jgi:predicted RecA/RadA family phage recombinase
MTTASIQTFEDVLEYLCAIAIAVDSIVIVKGRVGLALNAGAIGETIPVAVCGRITKLGSKATGEAWQLLDPIYWDSAASKFTRTRTAFFAGYAASAQVAASTTADVILTEVGVSGLMYAAAAASAVISNTVAETAFDKSFSIPADSLAPGDVIEIEALGICPSTNGTDTLTVKLKIGATVIVATPAVDVANNDIFAVKARLVVRTIGAGGTFVAMAEQALGVEGTVTEKPAKLASTAIDTTAAQAITVTAQWSVATAANQVRLDVLNVRKVR